jgi:hypothetical protein
VRIGNLAAPDDCHFQIHSSSLSNRYARRNALIVTSTRILEPVASLPYQLDEQHTSGIALCTLHAK